MTRQPRAPDYHHADARDAGGADCPARPRARDSASWWHPTALACALAVCVGLTGWLGGRGIDQLDRLAETVGSAQQQNAIVTERLAQLTVSIDTLTRRVERLEAK